MIHITANPTSPQDDWEPKCKSLGAKPNMPYNQWAEDADAAKRLSAEGQLVCRTCLENTLVEFDDAG